MDIEINENERIDVIVTSKSRGVIKICDISVKHVFIDQQTKFLNVWDEKSQTLCIFNENDWNYVDMIRKKEENDGWKTGTTD